MMNIFLWEMKSNRKGLIIWSICIILLNISAMSEFSAYYNNPEMIKIFEIIPESFMKAMSMEAANLTTVSGYFSMMVNYFFILLGIHAALLGSQILAKEERDKTAEFLFTLPVSRQRVITGKLAAAVVNCLVLLAVTNGIAVFTASRYELTSDFVFLLLRTSVAILLIQIIFLTMGMFLAALLKRHKVSGKISISIVLAAYILSIVMALTDKLDKLKFLSPFKYFSSLDLYHGASVGGCYLALSLAVIAAFGFMTYVLYPRRDLHI